MSGRSEHRASAGWLRTLHQWHWVSSALCLVAMVLFALTGITLNHAADIPASPRVQERQAVLPAALRPALAGEEEGRRPLPPPLREWLAAELDLTLDDREAEWSADEVYLSLPRPGGDAWLRLGRADGAVQYERTDRGWIAYLNDLHKGRHTGTAWRWFIDVFALAILVFCITGLLILHHHARSRPAVWPLVALGLVLPLLLLMAFLH